MNAIDMIVMCTMHQQGEPSNHTTFRGEEMLKLDGEYLRPSDRGLEDHRPITDVAWA